MTNDKETNLVIFLGDPIKFEVPDKQGEGKIELIKWNYLDIETGDADQLAMRVDNMSLYNAENIKTGKVNGQSFPIYAIMREWERKKNYQNLVLKSVKETDNLTIIKTDLPDTIDPLA